jgi:hypothetical protein
VQRSPGSKLAKVANGKQVKILGSGEFWRGRRNDVVPPVLIEWDKSVDIIEQKLKKRRES